MNQAIKQKTYRRVILDRQIVTDNWQYIGDEDSVPDQGDIVVSLDRWKNDQQTMSRHVGRIGVQLNEKTNIEEINISLNHIPLIVIDFPIIDTNKRGYHPVGCGYSQAYLLRSRYGYSGELRAIGDSVARDVLQYMERCGINSFDLAEGKDINDALKAFNEMTVAYQPSADKMQPAFIRRRNVA